MESVGLTDPSNYLVCATTLFKKRGALTATVRSNWAARLVVLNNVGLFWFEPQTAHKEGPLGVQRGRIYVQHIVSIQQHEVPPAEGATVGQRPVEEIERTGPRYQLDVKSVVYEHPIVIGHDERATVDAWHLALSSAVTIAASATPPPRQLGTPLGYPSQMNLLRLESLGILAAGQLQKCREGFLSARKGDSDWSTRFVVLTESNLFYFRQAPRKADAEDDAPSALSRGLSTTLSSCEYAFGERRGFMSLANANAAFETLKVDGVPYVQITLTSAPPSLSPTVRLGEIRRMILRLGEIRRMILRLGEIRRLILR